jgi:hypothetical protein
MAPEQELDPGHRRAQSTLRVIGPILTIAGLVFVAVGTISFFSSFSTFEPPRYFWCNFVGIPLLFVGLSMSMFGFLGAVARYQAGEVAPVATDVFNYMASGTGPGVRTAAHALGQGLASGMAEARQVSSPTQVTCSRCRAPNQSTAQFCKSCGTALPRTSSCRHCGRPTEPDARFCQHCGGQLV